MAKGTRLESVRGESLRGFKSHPFRQWRRGRRPDGDSHDAPGRTPHGAVASTALPVAVWFVGALWFFRHVVVSGFGKVHGDDGDSRLIALLHEHWWHVVRGERAWRDPAFFHPVRGVLGYSDTFLLDALAYVPLRVIGLSSLVATQVTTILLTAMGFAGWWCVIGRILGRERRWLRVGLTLLATFPHQLAQQVLHQQLMSVAWLPWLVLLGMEAARPDVSRRRRWGCAFSAGLLWGLVTTTAFYVGWFVLFTGGLVVVIGALVLAVGDGPRAVLAVVRRWGGRVSAAVAGLGLGLVPFLTVYLPVLDQRGGRPYWVVALYSPGSFDLVNVGRDNALWGAMLRAVVPGDPERLSDIERAMAVGPALLLVAVWAWRRGRPGREEGDAGGIVRDATIDHRWSTILLIVGGLTLVLPVEWGMVSTWKVVWAVVPGAAGLRAAGRLWLVTHMVVVLSLAVSLRRGALGGRTTGRAPARQWLRMPLLTALVVLLALEQVDLADRADVEVAATSRLVAAASPAPEWCEVVAVSGGETGQIYVMPSVEAMVIADAIGLPTLHGYSGQFPDGYPVNHAAPRYERQFRRYVRRLALDEAICRFDLDTRTWAEEPYDAG